MSQPTHRLLLSPTVPPPLQAALRAQYDALIPGGDVDFATLVAHHAHEVSVLVTTATDGANAERLRSLPKLRAVCSLGVGLDTLDLVTAQELGVVVSNTPDVLNDCVADLAIGLLIDGARGMSRADRHVRAGEWPRSGPGPMGTRVSGRRVGILGMGRIGQTIAKRLSGFDAEIRYTTRTPVAGVAHTHEPSLTALAEWCDFLIVACAGGESTRHLVNAPVLAALGPQGLVVNIARGSVIDEEALVSALQAGTLGAAALDVFANEPHVPEALKTLPNVVLLPHIGSATAQTRRAMGDLLLANIDAFIKTGNLKTPAY